MRLSLLEQNEGISLKKLLQQKLQCYFTLIYININKYSKYNRSNLTSPQVCDHVLGHQPTFENTPVESLLYSLLKIDDGGQLKIQNTSNVIHS